MKDALINLLKIKSIVTVLMTVAFIAMLFLRETLPQEFTVIYTSIISFYFGVQTTKKEQNDKTEV